jgi:hypothetical protein
VGHALTRRSFLTRAGLAAGAATAASVGGFELIRAVVAPPQAAALTSARRRTYVALVDAVGRGSQSQVEAARAGAAADWLAGDYAAALDPTRRAIDDVLDRLERAPGPRRPFSRLDPVARLAQLRALAAGTDADLAGRAVALAAAPFHPPADDYHPTPVSL